jgi:hypothetical protein
MKYVWKILNNLKRTYVIYKNDKCVLLLLLAHNSQNFAFGQCLTNKIKKWLGHN